MTLTDLCVTLVHLCVTAPADVPETAARPQVVSVQQRHRWDCGLACVMMVLPESKRHHFIDNFTAVCREEGFGKRSLYAAVVVTAVTGGGGGGGVHRVLAVTESWVEWSGTSWSEIP